MWHVPGCGPRRALVKFSREPPATLVSVTASPPQTRTSYNVRRAESDPTGVTWIGDLSPPPSRGITPDKLLGILHLQFPICDGRVTDPGPRRAEGVERLKAAPSRVLGHSHRPAPGDLSPSSLATCRGCGDYPLHLESCSPRVVLWEPVFQFQHRDDVEVHHLGVAKQLHVIICIPTNFLFYIIIK